MKSPANPYLQQVASRVGLSDERRGLQLYVRELVSSSASLEELARKLGVTEIVEAHLPFEGGLFESEDKRLVIKLNSDSSPSRKRFTLAHEIAHLILGAVPGHRKARGSDALLERACDSLAAEILMPTDEVSEFVRRLGVPAPEKLQAIASKYCVSLQAAAIRVHRDFHLWKCCVGLWERVPDIKTRWFVGRRRWDRVEIDAYSFELALSMNKAVRSTELWQAGQYSDPVSLNLLRVGNGCVLGLVGFAK